MSDDIRTLGRALDGRGARRARNLRRIGLVVMVGLVVASLLGVFGPSQQATTSAADGWELTLTAPSRTRGGLPAPVTIAVHRAGGFTMKTITIRLNRALFDVADFQTWYPNPSKETGDPQWVEYEFDSPDDDTLLIRLDSRIQPNQVPAVRPVTVWLRTDGAPPLSATVDALVLP